MAEHGGYRKPTNPAKTSGPGKLARRTDGQPVMDLTDAAYGENKEFRELQAGANMATTNGGSTPSGPGGMDLSQFTGLGAPTTQPGTPVTDGAEYGAGAGSAAVTPQTDMQTEDAKYLSKYLPNLIAIAEDDDTPPGTKRWIRAIIANS